jgi:dTDP-4-dehydrorhamnose reductase
MRILVTGAHGMLGRDLVPVLAARHETVGVDAADADLTAPQTAARLLDAHAPNWVINCAAYTAVDKAEAEPQTAAAINIEAARRLAEACARREARLLQVSTDYVFDGTKDTPYRPDDATNPLSVYGRTKRDGELAVLAALGERATIIRTAWLFGPHGQNFVGSILRQIAAGQPLRVVNDQQGSPTYTVHLAEALLAAVEHDLRGVHHAVNGGTCTWFEFARAICRAVGQPDHPLTAITTADLDRPARRPANSRLDVTSFATATGHALPHWRDALAAYLLR